MFKKNEAIKLNPNQIIISIKVTADDFRPQCKIIKELSLPIVGEISTENKPQLLKELRETLEETFKDFTNNMINFYEKN